MNRDTGVALAVGGLVTVVAAWAVVSLLDQSVSYPVMIGLLAVLFVGVLVGEIRVHRHPLTPAGMVAATGLLLFVLRPLTIVSSRATSPGAIADTRFFSPTLVLAGSAALVQCLLFFSLFFAVYYSLGRRRAAKDVELEHELPPERPRRVTDTRLLQWLVVLASAFALAAIAYLIFSSGGPRAYLQGLAVRSEFLSGRSFLALAYVPVQIALVLNVLHRRRLELPAWNTVNVLAVACLAVCGLTAGGRGPLVIGVVLPLVLLKQLGPKPFKLRTLGALGVGLVVVALTYSIVVRTSTFDQGRSLADFRSDPAGVLLGQLTSGAETRPFDSLIRLNEASRDDSFEFQNGATYATAPAWFVPRALWSEKPSGGGNTWFTREYVPRFYGTSRIETSLSAVGEGYANFGYGGVATAGLLLGGLASTLRPGGVSSRQKGLLGSALTVVLTPVLFSLVRGDLYQGGSLTLATTGLTCAAYWFTSRSPEKDVPAPVIASPALRPSSLLR